jgi:hypothetical protein
MMFFEVVSVCVFLHTPPTSATKKPLSTGPTSYQTIRTNATFNSTVFSRQPFPQSRPFPHSHFLPCLTKCLDLSTTQTKLDLKPERSSEFWAFSYQNTTTDSPNCPSRLYFVEDVKIWQGPMRQNQPIFTYWRTLLKIVQFSVLLSFFS